MALTALDLISKGVLGTKVVLVASGFDQQRGSDKAGPGPRPGPRLGLGKAGSGPRPGPVQSRIWLSLQRGTVFDLDAKVVLVARPGLASLG